MQELTPPIQWYSGTHFSGPSGAPALSLLASIFQLLHISWTMWPGLYNLTQCPPAPSMLPQIKAVHSFL